MLTDTVEYDYTATAAGHVWTAGACPLDEHGAVVAPGDLAAQTVRTLDNLEAALSGAGAALGDVVKTTIYVASSDRGDLGVAWDLYRDRLGAHRPPATLLGVAVLGYPGQLVEIEAVACIAGR
ncbi:RidA family protein [Dactylosporangium sp. NPDC051484]|uniref:RidA family protein n=1 Tax=Dactylosporangium sp. NPDC051484 TaxID=3154942 RepID=UPI00344E7D65